MIVYHEVNPSGVENILRHGIKRTINGEKSDDSTIRKTDTYLDTHRLETERQAGLSRSNNIYAYVSHDGHIIDITSGESVPMKTFVESSDKTVLQLTVDPTRCYVSDLDLYDTIKRSMELDEQDSTRENLARQYWGKLTPLDKFTVGDVKRPEIMITYDIPPGSLQVATAN